MKIYFGMLTLAFGMLFYTFLLKFYHLTGGDEGMRFLRPSLLGLDHARARRRRRTWSARTTTTRWPFWSSPPLVMWRIVHSPFGLCLRTIRDNPLKAESLGRQRPALPAGTPS